MILVFWFSEGFLIVSWVLLKGSLFIFPMGLVFWDIGGGFGVYCLGIFIIVDVVLVGDWLSFDEWHIARLFLKGWVHSILVLDILSKGLGIIRSVCSRGSAG